MWISEKEAAERLNNSKNILNRVERGWNDSVLDAPADHLVHVPDPSVSDSDDDADSDILSNELEAGPNSHKTARPAVDDLLTNFDSLTSTGPKHEGDGSDPEAPDEEFYDQLVPPGFRSKEELAYAAMMASLDPSLTGLELKRALKKAGLRTKETHLTKSEAADAVITGMMLGHDTAADLNGVHPGHISTMRYVENQSTHSKIPGLRPPPVLRELIEERKAQIRERAYNRLEKALDCLSNEKLEKIEKAREVAQVASQLATVADKMLPKEMQQDETIHFHVYRPEPRQESQYEIIEVNKPEETVEGELL